MSQPWNQLLLFRSVVFFVQCSCLSWRLRSRSSTGACRPWTQFWRSITPLFLRKQARFSMVTPVFYFYFTQVNFCLSIFPVVLIRLPILRFDVPSSSSDHQGLTCVVKSFYIKLSLFVNRFMLLFLHWSHARPWIFTSVLLISSSAQSHKWSQVSIQAQIWFSCTMEPYYYLSFRYFFVPRELMLSPVCCSSLQNRLMSIVTRMAVALVNVIDWITIKRWVVNCRLKILYNVAPRMDTWQIVFISPLVSLSAAKALMYI